MTEGDFDEKICSRCPNFYTVPMCHQCRYFTKSDSDAVYGFKKYNKPTRNWKYFKKVMKRLVDLERKAEE